ncbi:MAG: hypothetical protein R2941_15320 [Desulfobacterales bacterium]
MLAPQMEENILKVVNRWKSWSQLTEFAMLRHGYGISGVWEVRYPKDRAECRFGSEIPENCVYIGGLWDLTGRFEYILPETAYLRILEKALSERKLKKQARSIAILRTELNTEKYSATR